MSVIDHSDPTGWSDEKLEEHARTWCSLPLVRPGPIPDPEPDDEDEPLMGEAGPIASLGGVLVLAAVGLVGFAVSFIGEMLK